MLRVADVINKKSINEVYLSPSLIKDDRVKYFIKENISLIPYTPTTPEQILSDSKSKRLIIIDPDFDEKLGRAFWDEIKLQPDLTSDGIELLSSPDNKIDAFIMSQKF
jgi:hypothetical protein